MNWALERPTLEFTPTTGAADMRELRLFRQTVAQGATGIVTAAELNEAVRKQLRFAIPDAVERARRCLVTLTGPGALDLLETLVGKVEKGVHLSKGDLYPLMLQPEMHFSTAQQKVLTRFFGDQPKAILESLNGFYDPTTQKYKTSFSAGYVFRSVLLTTILGLNLKKVGVILSRSPQGQYGASYTNWPQGWKAPIPEPGTGTWPAPDVLEGLARGSKSMDEGYIRCNIIYAEAPDTTFAPIHMPGGVFRNSDYVTLTYIHECTHLFASTSDSYYFDKPWETGGVNAGADNPTNEVGKGGKPLTTRCLVNADSYAWLIYLLGDPRYAEL
jgi:hypothetical protein